MKELYITYTSMHTNDRTYSKITAMLFLIIAVVHALRIVYQWEAVIGGMVIPLWASWMAVLLGGYLSIRGFRAIKK